MSRLTRSLALAAFITGFSTLLFIFNISTGRIFFFSITGESLLRPIGSLTLIALTVLLAGCALIIRRFPGSESYLESKIERLLTYRWVENGIIYLTLSMVLIVVLFPINNLVTKDVRFVGVFQRYLPIWLLMAGYPIITLYYLSKWIAYRKILWIFFLSMGLIILAVIRNNYLATFAPNRLNYMFIDSLAYQISIILLVLLYTLILYSLSRDDQRALVLTTILTGCIYWNQEAMLLKPLSSFSRIATHNSVYYLFGLPLIAYWLFILGVRFNARVSQGLKGAIKVVVIVFMIAISYQYFTAAMKHAETINLDSGKTDQRAYLRFIREAARTNFHTTGDHNRMPGYPFVQALFYNEGLSDASLFQQGKTVNIVMSMVILAVLFIIFLKYLPFYQAVLLGLLLEFTLFIYRAPYVQAEIAFYFLLFCCYLLYMRLISRPSWQHAIIAGGVTALAYLTKGTILLSIPILLGVYLAKTIVISYWKKKKDGRWSINDLVRKGMYLGLFLMVSFIMIYPYTHSMKQRFGRYFYNVNTSIYVWLDSWDQALVYRDLYKVGKWWPDFLPEDLIPGPITYIKTHTYQDIENRFLSGIEDVSDRLLNQYSLINFPLTYVVILGLVTLTSPRSMIRFAKERPFIILFAGLFFIGYLLAFSWFVPIGRGRRFSYSLILPFLFSIFMAINGILKIRTRALPESINGTKPDSVYKFFVMANLTVAMALSYIIWFTLNYLIDFAGYLDIPD